MDSTIFSMIFFVGDLSAQDSNQSYLHRRLASSLDFPVGFKNGLDGNTHSCINSIKVANSQHGTIFLDEHGVLRTKRSHGNAFCHATLRGSCRNENYTQAEIKAMSFELKQQGQHPLVVVDCAHGNSKKTLSGQVEVFNYLNHHMKTLKRVLY